LAASAAAGASPLAPDSQDSAVIVNVLEGNYTVEVTGVNGAGGNVQEEVYELSSNGTRLVNASSRCFVGTGNDVMVVSLIVAGTGTEPLLLRADGPSLAKFGVVGAMLRPDLEVSGSRGGTRTNTGWANNPNWAEVSAAASQAGAFPLARDGADCAVVVKLLPGAYTMRISGSDESTGVALAEIYELP